MSGIGSTTGEVQGEPGTIEFGASRHLDLALATLSALSGDVIVHCLYQAATDSAPSSPRTDPLAAGLPDARWAHLAEHPLTYIQASDHAGTHRAWLQACDGIDRVGRVQVRTTTTMTDADGHEVGPVGAYDVTVIDLADVSGIEAVVVAMSPSPAAGADTASDHEHVSTDRPAGWFTGTTSFRLHLDAGGIIRGGTMNVVQMLGRPLVDLLGLPMRDLLHPDDVDRAGRNWRRTLEDASAPIETRARIAVAEQGWWWFDATSWNMLGVSRTGAVVTEFRDVHALVQTETARAATALDHNRLVRVFDEVEDMVMVTRLGGGIVYLNEAAATLFAGEAIGQRLADHARDDLRRFMISTVVPTLRRMQRWYGDIDLDVLGEQRTFATTATPVSEPDEDDIVVGVIMHDVTAERRHALELACQARHDSLTGLPNRLALMEHLERCRTSGPQDGTVSVCFIDLDNLKIVNDGLGHSAGDLLLQAVGAELATPDETMVARFGGDEFVVVHEDRTAAEVSRAAEHLLTLLSRVHVDGVVSHVTASVGVASCRRGDLDAERLIRDADAAMYVAKRSGRARVVTFDDAMRASVSRRFVLETSLRKALARDELDLHLQPVVDLATGTMIGVEALARWDEAAPAEFIPVAEESGLIGELGRWALDGALWRLSQLTEAAPHLGKLHVGVNVSADQLLDPGFAHLVLSALDAHGIEAGALVLELTESVLIDYREDSTRVLGQLHDAGIVLALDDFGSGFSSLGYLRRYPISVIKLDNSYTQALMSDHETRIIVESVLTMANRLGLRVIAEGVETEAQLAAVRELGVDWAQGYLLGRPTSVDALVAGLEPAAAVTTG